MISLQFKGLSRVFSNITVQKHQFFSAQLFLWSNSHIHNDSWKTIALTRRTFVGKVMSLLFNMLSRFFLFFYFYFYFIFLLSRFIIAFLPRSKCLLFFYFCKCLLISWLPSPPAMILEPEKIKSLSVSIVPLSIWHEVMGPDAMILVF